MVGSPLVTIGVTAYNASGSITDAVRSAMSQTWRPIEIVIVDDASSDGTVEIAQKLADGRPDIRVFVNRENGGVAVSRNRILDEARGDFVAFFDDDDESDPDRIRLQVNRIVGYERRWSPQAPVICHTARLVIYPGGVQRLEKTMGENEDRQAPFGPAVARRVLLGEPLRDGYGASPTCSQMARISTYRSVGGFDPAFRRGEDTDFNVRVALAGGHFVGIAAPLVTQTMTPTLEKTLVEQLEYSLLLLEKHRGFVESSGNYRFCRRWIEARHQFLLDRKLQFLLHMAALAFSHPFLTFNRLTASLRHFRQNRDYRRFHSESFDV